MLCVEARNSERVTTSAAERVCGLFRPHHCRRICAAVFGLGLSLCMSPLVSADALVDPTIPPVHASRGEQDSTPDSVQPAPQLQGIWMRERQRVAVLNGVRVRVGELIGGQRVAAIADDSVRLRGADGVVSTLRLMPQVRSIAKAWLSPSDGPSRLRDPAPTPEQHQDELALRR